MVTDEPAVLTWMIALAPRPRPRPTGRHWWRELVTTSWRAAYDQWHADAEAASNGWATELADFRAAHPIPRLGQFMVGLASGSIAPERVLG